MKPSINIEKIYWTKHARKKMRQYNLSETKLRKILQNPDRKELGIAPRTVAAMKINKGKKHPNEIWLMYQIEKIKNQKIKIKKIKIISAWRYPGKSPPGEPPPIPEDVLWEIKSLK
jgi:hypothetical protein